MKKTLIVMLALALLPLAACGKGAQTAARTAEKVDVDLTQLSSTMVYSEVYAMVNDTESYVGKSVRMRGQFASTENAGQRYYACIIQDATACCAQGLEFEPTNPERLPKPGAEITVQGTFDCYEEDAGNGNTYIYLVLRDATILT